MKLGSVLDMINPMWRLEMFPILNRVDFFLQRILYIIFFIVIYHYYLYKNSKIWGKIL